MDSFYEDLVEALRGRNTERTVLQGEESPVLQKHQRQEELKVRGSGNL